MSQGGACKWKQNIFEMHSYIIHSKTKISANKKRSPSEDEFKILIKKHITIIKDETLELIASQYTNSCKRRQYKWEKN